MVKEHILVKLAICCSVIGILVLFFISTEIEETSLAEITVDDFEEYVKVSGAITSVTQKEDFSVITIKQPSEIPIILFKNTTLKEGDQVEIYGQVDEYNHKPQLIADTVRVISYS